MSKYQDKDDDVLSYCGSISGETWTARRRKPVTLRQLSIETVARKLREQAFDDPTQTSVDCPPEPESKRKNTTFHSFRFVVVILGGFGLGLMLFLRYSLAVAIISMVNQTALYMDEHPNKTLDDFLAEGYTEGGDFDWNNEIQQMLMSWYMLAYALPQLPCTKIAVSVGCRKAMPICLLICALSVLLTPTVAYWGWQWVLAMRLLQGIGASAVLPLLLNMIEHWMPYEELSLGLTCIGLLQATLASLPNVLIGYLCEIHWTLAFYVPGAVTVIFCIIYIIFVTDTPDESPFISSKELNLIDGCASEQEESVDGKHTQDKKIEGKDKKNNNTAEEAEEFAAPNWIDVLRVPSFYAYLMVWMFWSSSQVVFLFILPTYLRQFLKIHLSMNGLYCSMIQSGSLLAYLWPQPLLQFLEHTLGLSRTAARRTACAVICCMVSGTSLFVGAFHEDQIIVLFINRCFQQSNDVVITGSLMNNFAKSGISSEVFSMVNTAGNFSVLFSSTLVGYILDYTRQSEWGWSCIYIGLGFMQIVQMLIFCTCIRSDPIDLKGKKLPGKKLDNVKVAE